MVKTEVMAGQLKLSTVICTIVENNVHKGVDKMHQHIE